MAAAGAHSDLFKKYNSENKQIFFQSKRPMKILHVCFRISFESFSITEVLTISTNLGHDIKY